MVRALIGCSNVELPLTQRPMATKHHSVAASSLMPGRRSFLSATLLGSRWLSFLVVPL